MSGPVRIGVLFAAFWCAGFALMHLVQTLVLIAPASLQPSLSFAWGVAATVYAPVGVWVFRRSQEPVQ